MATPDFILRLRERVGTELLWLTGVTAVIVREEPVRQVLLVRRADTGAWTAVTGVIDPGETVAGTARREALEEAGVEIEVERVVWLHTLPPMEYPNGDRAQYLDHVLRARYLSGEAHVADDESSEVGWFAPDALPPMSADHRERISRALSDETACAFD
ncbi:NUDIX domain-containing protein [Rathayibacter festucae]|uniref:NUDIX domain-containing protein n=1 Tax=Rathayibacter festucae TaxID=110937 RepID=A0ABX6H2Q9_9MICO|nr:MULTISPECIES: NUDIX domain-containing protein [Rathayibacter]MCJ1699013.1 NUDIX domain-containing protein [Rathayibacter festucae]QHC63977.1 NUDIX domain-containing protein [Rathayibacter festucae]ROQ15759.1 ADP-ribose pyrophosphatase YjhB (NUDIX family) [Rathayibacter sp. PhB93]ROQ57154.1 ADP-ribose pyrophosphatase YjhB (NUDIX family) [Rathayibacter sp. PhB152]ROS28561.1 ADP-ribose pyrophosphatase YjhB (NUDIX family) [Rathayibacter sp. PhB127]